MSAVQLNRYKSSALLHVHTNYDRSNCQDRSSTPSSHRQLGYWHINCQHSS